MSYGRIMKYVKMGLDGVISHEAALGNIKNVCTHMADRQRRYGAKDKQAARVAELRGLIEQGLVTGLKVDHAVQLLREGIDREHLAMMLWSQLKVSSRLKYADGSDVRKSHCIPVFHGWPVAGKVKLSRQERRAMWRAGGV